MPLTVERAAEAPAAQVRPRLLARVRRDSRPCHWNGAHADSSSARQPFMLRNSAAPRSTASPAGLQQHDLLGGILAQASGQHAAGAAAADDQPVRFDRPWHHTPTFIHTLLICVSSSIDAPPSVLPWPEMLTAAVRHRRVDHLVRVDPHRAGAQRRRGAVGAREVVRPHAGGEAVLGVVGDRVGLLLGGEREDRHHRPEDLLLGDAHVVAHAGEDGRLVEVARVAVALAAEHQLGALVAADARRSA